MQRQLFFKTRNLLGKREMCSTIIEISIKLYNIRHKQHYNLNYLTHVLFPPHQFSLYALCFIVLVLAQRQEQVNYPPCSFLVFSSLICLCHLPGVVCGADGSTASNRSSRSTTIFDAKNVPQWMSSYAISCQLTPHSPHMLVPGLFRLLSCAALTLYLCVFESCPRS